jgi:hypothetical protein
MRTGSTKGDAADEADIAISLRPTEAANLDQYFEDGGGHWTGWQRRHWPANIVRPGLRLYGFDVRPEQRRLCCLLRVNRGGSFTYRSKVEFAKQVGRITGWKGIHNDVHWHRIPGGSKHRLSTGVAMSFEFIKRVNIDLGPIRFPQIGWLKLNRINESDTADLYEEGRRFLRAHWAIERHSSLRSEAKAYWRKKLSGRLRCLACDFDFFANYGAHGEDWIELHHENPLGFSREVRNTRVEELKPLCSNCHRMIHRRAARCLSLNELRAILRRAPYSES